MKQKLPYLLILFTIVFTLFLPILNISVSAAETTATLTFDSTSKRTSFSTSTQVWEENGIKLTNNKSSSTSNVADYAKPARFYKSSKIIIEAPGVITNIVFDCNSASYATAMKNSITDGVATTSSDKVTVVPTGASNTYTISSLTGGQVRLDAITVTYSSADECAHTETEESITKAATCTENGTKSVICLECGEKLSDVIIPATGHQNTTSNKIDATCSTEGSETVICNDCGTTVSNNIIPTTAHSYSEGVCSVCGQAKPEDPLGLDGKAFYIAAKRSTGNYLYMTNDLGTNPTSRYQAIDSGLTELPASITADLAQEKCIFVFEFIDAGSYYIYSAYGNDGSNYIGYTSGNSGTLVSRADAMVLKVEVPDGKDYYHISFSDESRSLELNTSNNYFAFYENTQIGELYLVPTAEACAHESVTSTTTTLPTCTDTGILTTTCNVCQNLISTQVIDALGHDLITNADSSICARCGYTEQYTPPAGAPSESGWILVTDVSTLREGDTIVIVANAYNYAISTTQNKNNRGQASVTKDGNTVTFGSDVQVITLEAGTVDGSFAFKVEEGYLYAASSSSNYLRTADTLNENGSWSITIDGNGVATIKAQGNYTKNWLRYNDSSTLFACYSTGQKDVSIYKLERGNEGETTEDVSIYGASMTVGSTLAMNYYVAGCIGSNYYMTFSVNGTVSEPVTGINQYGYLMFTFDNIPPHMMSETISAMVYDGEGNALLDEAFEFSVKEYATKVLSLYGNDEKLSNLVADMLKYGAAAQRYKNFALNSLATTDIDLTDKGNTSTPTNTDDARTNVIEADTGIDKNVYAFTATGVRFDFDNKIYVKFKTDDISKIKLTCNGKNVTASIEAGEGIYVFYTDGISATEFDKVFTFQLYVDDVLCQTITYSVNSYAYAKYDGQTDGISDLVIALYRYGLSAKEYAGW